MDRAQFDAYRQQVWTDAVLIVGEHDAKAAAGLLTPIVLGSLLNRLESLLVTFEQVYQDNRQALGSWADTRFHDYYDFLGGIAGDWRAAGGVGAGVGVFVPLEGGTVFQKIYRLILFVPDRGVYGTSGTYADCSPSTPGGCQGREFPTVQEAVEFARANNEIPVLINLEYDAGVDEAWRIAGGGEPVYPGSFVIKDVTASGGVIPENPGLLASIGLGSIPPVAVGAAVLLGAVMLGRGRK